MDLAKHYQPFSFSSTGCHIVVVTINGYGVTKIEEKLPLEIKRLKGIFVTARVNEKYRKLGRISLSFNGGSLNPFQQAVINTDLLSDCSRPVPLGEILKSNSIMQGFFYADRIETAFPYKIKIYLHYERD